MLDENPFEIIVKLDMKSFEKRLLEMISENMKTNKTPDEYITKKGLMQLTKIKSPTTIKKYIDLGIFDPIIIGGVQLFKRSDSIEAIEEHKLKKY